MVQRGGASIRWWESHEDNAYRAVYTVRYGDAVNVLHAFQKKSKHGIETPKAEIDLIAKRLKTWSKKRRGDDHKDTPPAGARARETRAGAAAMDPGMRAVAWPERRCGRYTLDEAKAEFRAAWQGPLSVRSGHNMLNLSLSAHAPSWRTGAPLPRQLSDVKANLCSG
jgi:Gp49-like protein DUF891